jgi:hypothetical protein
MTPPLDVEKQRFEFSDAWTLAFKYDDSRFYREGPERLKGDVDGVSQSTRAVDVVAIHRKMGILLLEPVSKPVCRAFKRVAAGWSFSTTV